MGGCTAVNCSNSRRKGCRLFRFPKDPNRRKMWLQNCRRDKWIPSNSSELCEVHFEEGQFEQNRLDELKKLKPNAIPTVFNVPNPPRLLESSRKSLYKTVSSCSIERSNQNLTNRSLAKNKLSHDLVVSENIYSVVEDCLFDDSSEDLENIRLEIKRLQAENDQMKSKLIIKKAQDQEIEKIQLANKLAQEENENLMSEIKKSNELLKRFLNGDQILALSNPPRQWTNDTIIKGLKMQFALGVHGYEYLRETKYPLPAYSTLTRRLRQFKLNFGVFSDLLEPLTHKVYCMEKADPFCSMSVDEMEINPQLSYNKNCCQMFGNVTIGNSTKLEYKLLVVLIRGVKNTWKQIIGAHITNGAVNNKLFKNFIFHCIDYVENCGIQVISLSSDMGNSNRTLWTSLGIQIKKGGIRENKFYYNNHYIFITPDVCHLIKNLKSTMLKGDIILPETYCDISGLPNRIVKGSYVSKLWNEEINQGKELRLLHHLNQNDVFPDNFQKMNVGAAIRFFSLKTAVALELAVQLKILPHDALTTAHSIRIIDEWFTLTASKVRKTSITKNNKELKYDFLEKMIILFENLSIGDGWKPLNVGFILSALSLIDIAETLFNCGFDFLICHRFTQDAIENIFSQVRRKSGAIPTATQCLSSLKIISISQFISDIKRNSYVTDSDTYLINFFHKSNHNDTNIANSNEGVEYLSYGIPTSDVFETKTIEFLTMVLNKQELNSLYHIGGSTVNMLLKYCCETCKLIIQKNCNESLDTIKTYSRHINKEGLKNPCKELLQIIFNCELLYTKYKMYIIHNSSNDLIDKIIKDLSVELPVCQNVCNIKEKIVKHYFTVRSYATANFSVNSKKRKTIYGTASTKKNKV